MEATFTNVPITKFGKDHWGLLAYVECRCVDHSGILDKRHLRCNGERHPLHNVNANFGVNHSWKESWGTRLKGFFTVEESVKKDYQLPFHDDWDVLNDLEAAGLLEVMSEANAFVKLTELGNAVAGKLREHKTKGGNYADFNS